jgi:TolB protein
VGEAEMSLKRITPFILLLLLIFGLRSVSAQTDFCNYLYARFSPDGERIVYTAQCTDTGGENILVADADGSRRVKLTFGSDRNTCPVWSPDGTQLAFISDRSGIRNVYVMNADGTALTNLTESESNESCPEWSPDGTQITFIRDTDDLWGGDLYVINSDGSNLVNLMNGTYLLGGFDWSPDGQTIAFSTNEDDYYGGDLYLMNPDGTGIVNLTDDDVRDSCPSWSPDGEQIAFSTRSEMGSWGLVVMLSDGSEITPLTDYASGIFPICAIWSPDGQRLMFSVTTGMLTGAYRVNADGTNLEPLLAPNSVFPADTGRFYPSDWSPDGEQFLFIADIFSAEIYIADADGTNPVEIIGLE